jgi:hypothetical protein
VRKQTVLTWLNKAYLCTYGEPFTDDDDDHPQQQKQPRTAQQPACNQHQQQAEAPAQQPQQHQGVQQDGEGLGQAAAAAAGDQQPQGEEGLAQEATATEQKQQDILLRNCIQYDTTQGLTFVMLTELLLFADAVGSSPPLLQACVPDPEQLAALRLRVLLPLIGGGMQRLDIHIDAACEWGSSALFQAAPARAIPPVTCAKEADFPLMQAGVTQQVQHQLEVLLYAAYKLQLSTLAELLEVFIRHQVSFPNSILRCQLRPVMSARVLAAAGGFQQLQESMLLQRWCTSACSLNPLMGACRMALATPTVATLGQKLRTSVVMLEDYLGHPKGLRSEVEVDAVSGTVTLTGVQHLMQLQVGPPASTAAERKLQLGPAPMYKPPALPAQPAPAAVAAGDDDDDDD